ncbi:hypothetical protein KIL84_015638 [Mauremys mutica]|uniref:Uncharacterized protein n=1 Tax=Mauremys mutica TaxID=74926 RepID=A0A9D3WT25_9SAUR|nr:hypothetical protein KIL84_015638 [Mauremys mutica]
MVIEERLQVHNFLLVMNFHIISRSKCVLITGVFKPVLIQPAFLFPHTVKSLEAQCNTDFISFEFILRFSSIDTLSFQYTCSFVLAGSKNDHFYLERFHLKI